jgi:hypothetical protein
MAHWSLDPLMFVWREMVAQIRCHKITEGAKFNFDSSTLGYFYLSQGEPHYKIEQH